MTAADPNKGRADLLPSVLFGLAAGALVGLVTSALSQTDIGGSNWSLRGNGALAVLFSGCGAVLACGWLALADRARGRRLDPGRVLPVFVVILILELVISFAPILLGAADAFSVQLVVIGGCLVLALVYGVALAGGGLLAGQVVALVALLLTMAPGGFSSVLVPILLPLALAVPSLSLARGPWLAANSIALLLATVVGVALSQFVANR